MLKKKPLLQTIALYEDRSKNLSVSLGSPCRILPKCRHDWACMSTPIPKFRLRTFCIFHECLFVCKKSQYDLSITSGQSER